MKAFQHSTEGINVTNLLPICGNSTASLSAAEALYPTANHGITGISLFKAPDGQPYTNHGVVIGKTGFGKSVTSIDLATQIQPHVDLTVIIESGQSWAGYVATFGSLANSLIIDPNGDDVLNYLDPGGHPLSPQHLKDAIGVMMRMIGFDASQALNKLRASKLRTLLQQFYRAHLDQWKTRNKSRVAEISREFGKMQALAQLKKMSKRPLSGRFRVYQDWKSGEQPPEALSDPSEAPDGLDANSDFFCFAYAFLTPEEAPTHSQFHDWLKTQFSEKDKLTTDEELFLLNLGSWRADEGENGRLFDGVTTFHFDGPIILIELGLIPDNDKDLKRLAAYLVSNFVRNKVTRMPRGTKKILIVEELGSFLSFQDAEHIMSDLFERGRKYQACVLTIVQQLTRIPEDLRNCIINNSSFGMFFRQGGSKNAQALQEGFNLPEATTLELTKLPRPTKEAGASFICWQAGDESPSISRAYHLATPEMLYIAESSGKNFEARAKALAAHANILEGIRIEAHKTTEI